MKKRTLTYMGLVVSIMLMLTSCKSDFLESFGSDEVTDGDPVTLTFKTSFPTAAVSTRTVDDIKNLTLLVFDENHRYLYRAKAVLEGTPKVVPSGVDFVPDHTRDPIDNKVYEFSVTLMSSARPRIIHFVANYDGFDTSFGGDYEHDGADEGEVMPKIISKDADQYTYWQVFKFEKIKEDSFRNKAFKLLRNEAKITVVEAAHEFTMKGFSIHNAPDRGTIAPYIPKSSLETDPRGIYSDVMYSFPIDPVRPTIPAGIELKKLGVTESNQSSIPIYEYSNSRADADKQMSVIVCGQRDQDSKPSYYKLDIVEDIYADEAKQNFIGTRKVDIVRNYNYVLRITSSKGEGYATYEEAARNPASNDLFASVELQDFPEVTDGTYTLIVDNTNAIMTLPGLFASQILFSGVNLSSPPTRDVKVFLNEKECKGAITGDQYIDFAKYDPETGVLSVNVTKIPDNEDKHYIFTVVGTPPNTQTHIQRTINLVLRKRYDFNLKLEEKSYTRNQGDEVDLKFTVPGTLPSTLYPFDVHIAADQLSPLVNAYHNDQMKVQKIGKRTFYVYTVRTAVPTDTEVTLHFQRTTTNGSCDVTLSSENFNNADVILPNDKSNSTSSRGKLTYSGGSYVVPKIVPSAYRTKIKATGASGVSAKMASAGYVEFSGLDYAYDSDNLTLTAEINVGNGTIVATKTQTVSQWKNLLNSSQTMDLDISKVIVKGTLRYQIFGHWTPVPNQSSSVSVSADNGSVHPDLRMTADGVYELTVDNLNTIKKPVAFTFQYNRVGTEYKSNSMYISKLFDYPAVSLTGR